nr:alpha-L-fucosidase [Candidatus Sigynarchaeota archaeon]
SFGYNQFETAEHYLTPEQLIHSFIDVVSKNGNLLLNVGPRADGSIPELQLERLQALGRWLNRNSDGIYNTKPYICAGSTTQDSTQVRFTQNDDIYAFILGVPLKGQVIIKKFVAPPNAEITVMGLEDPVTWKNIGKDLSIELPGIDPAWIAVGLRIRRPSS